MTAGRLIAVLAFCAQGAAAQELSLPSNATLTATQAEPLASYLLPTGPWAPEGMEVLPTEGEVTHQSWRIDAPDISSLQLLRPLRAQLRDDGFDILYECETKGCGGFDFRFSLPVILPPDMEVNLSDFRFLAARQDDRAVAVLASRTSQAGFVQVTFVRPEGAGDLDVARTAPAARASGVAAEADSLEEALATTGRFVLDGLAFAPGSAQLSDGAVASLDELADYLARFPDRTVALVGHTDASGSLEANVALSRRRAASVLERLVSSYQTPRRQLEAQGMGYLAPIASNLTEDGRAQNRRVEVIVTSTTP